MTWNPKAFQTRALLGQRQDVSDCGDFMGTESRKLAAVLFADMVGFSALRQAVALELRDELLALASQGLAPHRGRVVNIMGDGFFAEFPTALDAAQFAVDLQQAVAARNREPKAERTARLRLRIGIHVGEVVVQGDAILGGTVNIAARTEKLAAPGGICMTAQVWEQVREDLPQRARGLGKIHVRNIHQRLSFYHVDPPEVGLAFWLVHWVRRGAFGFGPLLAGSLMVLAGLLAWISWGPRQPLNPEQRFKRAENLLKHYDQKHHLADALDDLKQAAQAEPPSAQVLAKLAWANWLLYEEDDHEATRWEASRYASNSLSLNPENAEGYLVQGLIARDKRDLLTATNCLLKAKDLTRSSDGLTLIALAAAFRTAGDLRAANEFARLAEQAAGDDWLVFDRLGLFHFRTQPRDQDLLLARQSFEQAIRCSPNSPLAHLHLGYVLLLQHATSRAKAEIERSVALCRTPEALSALGSLYYSIHNNSKAADYFGQASRADPLRFNYRINAGLALRETSDGREAAREQLDQALRQLQSLLNGGEKPLARAYEGLCLAALGRPEEARPDLQRAEQEAPQDNDVLRILFDGYTTLSDWTNAARIDDLQRKKAP